MPRIRAIQPHFARSPSMGRVSREARLLFVLLWTVVDDYGRSHANADDLTRVLYPNDAGIAHCIRTWLSELVREGCIEEYVVDGIDYLHIVHWHQHQRIYHPTPSYLPPPPHEALNDSGIREVSGKLRGRDRKVQANQGPGGRSDTFPENDDFSADDSAPVVVTDQLLLRHIERIRANAEADRSHSSALRSVAMLAEYRENPGGKKDKDTAESSVQPSVADNVRF